MEAGANQRVTTDSGIVLDFAGLFGDCVEQKRPSKMPSETILEGGQYKTITEHKKTVETPSEDLEGQQAKGLYLQAQREAAEKQRTLDIFREYQENIKRSGQLQTEILKGVKAGESVYNLFLKAVKAISLMTSNSLFYSQIEADTRAIYGEGLQEQAPLQCELAEVQKRLARRICSWLADRQRVCRMGRERIKKDPLKSDKLRSGFILIWKRVQPPDHSQERRQPLRGYQAGVWLSCSPAGL